MGFRDESEAMRARIQSLEADLAKATAVAERVAALEAENGTLRAELAKYKKRDDPPKAKAAPPRGKHALAFRVVEPGGATRELTLAGSVIKIGTLSSSHIRLSNDDDASRMHAVIDVDKGVEIIDLGSASGTRVNGKKVRKAKLRDGDEIRVGGTVIVIGIEG